MTIVKAIVCASLLFFGASPSVIGSQTKEAQNLQESCRTFVQAFYDWYLPKTSEEELKKLQGSPADLALKEKRSSFSPELYQLLKEDSEAQAKADEIVGLDFDPFLASNGGDEKYALGNITVRDRNCFVEIYGIDESGKRREKPALWPELAFKGGQWAFVNFYYESPEQPKSSNLLTVLRSLRTQRQNPRK